MAYAIRINPTAFNAGNPLASVASMDRQRIRIGVGKADVSSYNADGLGVDYTRDALKTGALFSITVDNMSMDETQFARLNQFYKNSLADLVKKGIIIVEKAGVAQTAAQVIAA